MKFNRHYRATRSSLIVGTVLCLSIGNFISLASNQAVAEIQENDEINQQVYQIVGGKDSVGSKEDKAIVLLYVSPSGKYCTGTFIHPTIPQRFKIGEAIY